MRTIKATCVPHSIVLSEMNTNNVLYPFLKDEKGKESMYTVSPSHGRSFVMNKLSDFCWIVGKGNGLSYSQSTFLLTSSLRAETWGALALKSAIRDYKIGNEVRKLGIKTNIMECVLKLDNKIMQDGELVDAALLQYSVECPYRICDFAFMSSDDVQKYMRKWPLAKSATRKGQYLVAAETLISNLRILHDNGIMHNAINIQNHTWALELLDFEASRSERIPYDNIEYEQHVPMLIEMEILQTYEIINYIAWCLRERIDYKVVDALFSDYGFDLMEYKLK